MKKLIFLLLATIGMQAQTYQNPTFGTVKTKTAPTVTTTPHLGTVETDGTISKITPENLPVSTATQSAIDAKVGDFINDGATTIAPSMNAVYDGLILKQTVFTGIAQEQFLTENDLVFDNAALTLTIATVKNGTAINAGNPVRFFTDGNGVAVKHEKTSPVVFTFTNTTGIWYFYFDSNGNPVASQSEFTDPSTVANVYRMYWNSALATADKRVIESIQVYKNDVSWVDRDWKNTQGAQYVSGLDLSHNAATSGTPNANGSNAVVTLSSGTLIDSNFEYTLTNASSGTTKFTQDLGSGLLPATSGKFITITNNAGGVLNKIAATDFPFLWNSGTNTPEYLTVSGVRTGVTNNYFFVYYLYAFQDPRRGETVKLKSATTDFSNSTDAEAHTWSQLQAQFPTLRDSRIRVLYKLTFEYKSSYDVGTKKSALRKVDDVRKTRITTTASVGGSVPATSVTVSPIGGISSTNAQSALQELDSDKENVTNKATDFTTVNNTLYPSVQAVQNTFKYKKIVYEGDSMTDISCGGVYCPTNYPSQIGDYNADVARAIQINLATSGQRLSAFISNGDYVSQVQPHKPTSNKETVPFLFWLGVNDFFDGRTALQVYDDLKIVWAQAKVDKFTVVAFTISRTTNASVDAKVIEVNEMIDSDPTLYDLLVRTDLILPDPTNLTYFNADGLHLTAAGSQKVAQELNEVLSHQINGYDSSEIALSVINGKTDLQSVSATTIIKKGAISTDALLAGGGTLANPVGTTGTLVANYIPKVTGINTINNSRIAENATDLDIDSKVNITGITTATSFVKSGAATGNMLLAGGSDIPQSTFQTALTNPVTGTGTVNYIPKWTGPGTQGNSIISDDGTTVSNTGRFLSTSTTAPGFYQARLSDTMGGGVIGGNSFSIRNGSTSEDLNFDVFDRTLSAWTTPLKLLNNGGAAVFSSTVTAISFNGGAILTGTPIAPTATAGTNTTQIATTAFVQAATVGSYVDLTTTQTITGSKSFTSGNNYFGNALTHYYLNNPANAISWTLQEGGASQGHFKFGTNTVKLEMRESGPRYISVTDPIESPAPTATSHLVNKGYSDKNRLIPYTFATLPTSPSQGDSYSITDALTPAYLAPAAGGGAVFCPVVWNGTEWVCH